MSPDAHLIASPRRRYYNPMLDYRLLRKMTSLMQQATIDGQYNDGSVTGGGPLLEPDDAHPYNLVSSLRADGMHSPALDIDGPVTRDAAGNACICDDQPIVEGTPVVVVPSSSLDHFHVYIPWMVLTGPAYFEFLYEMAAREVITESYLAHSLKRGQTLLRPPHVRKIVRLVAPATDHEDAF